MKKTSREFVFTAWLNPVFLVALGFSMLLPVSLAAESLHCLVDAGGYRLVGSEVKGYAIEMSDAGYGRLNSPGDPVLPEKIIELKVPREGVVSHLELTVNNADVAVLPDQYDLVPGTPFTDGTRTYWGEGKSIVNGKNVYVYKKNAFFPGGTVELLPTVTKKEPAGQDGKRKIYRLVRYIRLAFHPFAYNPVARQLQLTRTASVTITYDVAALDKASPKESPVSAADYVIITTNEIVAKSGMLQSFMNMKEAAGHTVRILTEDDYGSLTGQAPNGTAEKIRQWLMNNYLDLGIDYVLFIGDPTPADVLDPSVIAGDVPMKMCYPQYGEYDNVEYPTDFFYGDLVGNWDLDGDGLYGENMAVDHPISPSPSINPDNFSARWTGKVKIDYAEEYYIGALSDDGVRIYLDNDPVPIVDNWTDHTYPTLYDSQFMTLPVGLHDLTVEYYQNTGDAVIRLYWQNITRDKERSIIPADHLYHYDAASSAYVAGGLDVSYYNTIDLSGTPAVTAVDIINNVWVTGDNGDGGRQPASQVSVGRIPVYKSDYSALDNILIKIIAYETDPADISWRRSILLPMKPFNEIDLAYPLGEAIKVNVADPYGYESCRIYQEDYNPPTPEIWPCTVENVVEEWINHYGMVTWSTHGGYEHATGVITNSDVEPLDDAYPSITFQDSCDTGYPEKPDNLGYTLLKHGCAATVSASRVTYGPFSGKIDSGYSADMAYFFTSYVLADNGTPMTIGDALQEVRRNMPAVGLNTMAFNVYGDPDCRLLTTYPRVRPVAVLSGPYSCNEGESVTLDASGSYDPADGALQYRWDTNGDGKYDTGWSSSPTHTAQFTKFTNAYVQVKVDIGVTAGASASVVVSNLPPVAEAGPDQTAFVYTSVSFNGSATDPGDDVETYEWNFGDGTPVDTGSLTPTHTYTKTGTYTVTLKVWDALAASDTDTLTVTVTAAPFNPLSNEFPTRPWTKKFGNFNLTNDAGIKSEGSLSLKLGGNGYMVVATTVFNSNELTSYSNELSLDVYMPSQGSNPYWRGQVQVFVTCPGANVYYYQVGQIELTGIPFDSWYPISFTLPSNIVDVFKGSYGGNQIQVAVNNLQSPDNPYRIDNLRFIGDIIVKPPVPSAKLLENIWSAGTKTATYLTLNSASDNSPIYCQIKHDGWASQQWVLEPVSGYSDRYRLKCLWNNGSTYYYLTATGTSGAGNGDPVVGKALQGYGNSQVWIKESGRNGSTRLKSAWSNSTYLTVKTADDVAAVVCQPYNYDWASQEWNIK